MEYPIASVAYLAGLIDGEGCVRVGRYKNSSGNLRYRAFLVIAMTDARPLKWVSRTFGGNVYYEERQGISKPVYSWQVNAKQAAQILRLCLPYLKVKREQARNVVNFAATLAGPGGKGLPKNLPEQLLQKRRRMFERGKILNRKGRL